jgi:hypothetical protein
MQEYCTLLTEETCISIPYPKDFSKIKTPTKELTAMQSPLTF